MQPEFVVICADCGSPMVLRVTNKRYYGDGTPQKFFDCSRFPLCRATHGATPDGKPLGTPARDDVKAMRQQMHQLANQIWDYKDKQQKGNMYRWLRKNTKSGHIGRMDKLELLDLKAKLENLIVEFSTAN